MSRMAEGVSDFADFLPGLLEIQQRPPSPAGRILLWSLLGLLLSAFGWACLGSVDIIASARGRVVTSGREQLVQPLVDGVIRAIRVREGERVQAGQLLVELDPTAGQAELEQRRTALVQAEADIRRLQGVLERIGKTGLAPSSPGDPAGTGETALEESQVATARSRLQMLDREVESHRAALAAARGEVEKYASLLPLQQRRSSRLRSLVERHLHPEVQWLEVEEAVVRTRHELGVQRARLRQAEAEIRRLTAERANVLAALRSDLLGQLEEARQRHRQLQQEIEKARWRLRQTRLTAPVSGVVQDLAVHTVGGVVRPAQVLMRIVADEQPREIEAWLLNRDIGFVHPGQGVEVKVDAFPFTRYGVLDGRVKRLAADARREADSGWVYRAAISLQRDWLPVEGRRVRLSPGMAVTVEIRTGERRIIDFLLSPLLRLRQESLRER